MCGSESIVIEGSEGAALPESTYEITVELEGSVYSTVCASPGPGMNSCEPAEGVGVVRLSGDFTSSGTLVLTLSDEGGPGSLEPSVLSLSVIAGDALLVDESWELTYETCRAATETLVATVDLPPE